MSSNPHLTPIREDDEYMTTFYSQTGPSVGPQTGGKRHDGNKTVHCRVHDQMVFPAVVVRIMDTPQFQRLRDLLQLGNTRYVFPGACHSRFEHSLGVAHLSRQLLRKLRDALAEEDESPLSRMRITKEDELCVTIAGLCHDLGHGPTSHNFEDFVNEVRRRKEKEGGPKFVEFHHEAASIQLLDHLLVENDIELADYGLGPQDLTFIKLLIQGLKPSDPWPAGTGRDADKRFMFDIVANKRNGIDVDKLDYFLRDSMSVYGKLPDIAIDRILTCARIIEFEGQTTVGFEEKVALSLGELFSLRAKLHKFVYQHRVTKLVDQMTNEALFLAERSGFSVSRPDGTTCRLSETVDDIATYAKTGDWILNAISATSDPALEPARTVLDRIRKRQFYPLVGICDIIKMKPLIKASPGDWKNKVAQEISQRIDHAVRSQVDGANTIHLIDSYIKYGSSDTKEPSDPINNVVFFNPKHNPFEGFKLPKNRISPLFSPREFEERTLYVYSRDEEYTAAIHAAFKLWKAEMLDRGSVRETTPHVNASPVGMKRRQSSILGGDGGEDASNPMLSPRNDSMGGRRLESLL